MNIAHAVSTFADSEIKAAKANGESEHTAIARAWKCARENGGRARTSGSTLLGYRFPDGSAITANCVEFLGTFKGERGYSEAPAPNTDAQILAAADRAQEMATATLQQKAPFLGVFGAAAQSGIEDAAMAKVCGHMYLILIERGTYYVATDHANFLDGGCIK